MDGNEVAVVADALAFEHKYTSGVIAWAPDDTPTDAQIGAVIDAFEQTAWAGLEPDRYAWAAVVHRERDGGVHVHVLAVRCDLETGRSLNIAPPGWQKTFDPLRDAFNAEEGWSRPDDPALARVQQPGHRAYVEAAHLRAGLALEPSPRDLIRDYLLQRVEHGTEPCRCRRRPASNALRIIEADTAVATGRMRALLLNAWLRPLVVGLSLWLGICGGSWATMHWLSTRIQARIQTAAALDLGIEEARQTLTRLEAATWGITLREIEGERFVVLPAGALAYPPRTVGARPAVKLSNE